jgi:hypothetical protein
MRCIRWRGEGYRSGVECMGAGYEMAMIGWIEVALIDREYIPWPGWPSNAADEATMITTPRSPSGFSGVVRAMCGKH